MFNKKKIFIFGATGSTGIYLTEYLFNTLDKNEYEIVPVGKRETNYFSKFNMKYYSVDITQKDSLNILPTTNAYATIILSGMLPARMKEYHPEQYVDINIKGTLNIMEHLKDSGIDRVVYAVSVSDLHGYLPEHKELLPDMPIKYKYGNDHTIYAITKTAASEILETYHKNYGIKRFILRLPNIYMYSPEKTYYVNCSQRLISYRYLIDRAINGEPLELWGNPEQKREIVYVKDFCQIVMKAVIADVDGGYYNVGADLMVSMQEQIEGIIRVFSTGNKKSEIIYCPEKPSCDETHLNIDKTREILKYNPQYGYIDYLKDYKKEMNSDRFSNL